MFRKAFLVLFFSFFNFLLQSHECSTTAGPNVRFSFASKQLISQSAYCVFGEMGEKLVRVNGTIGYQIGSSQRIKFSVDQLCEKLTYQSSPKNIQRWMRQIAGGFSYKYFLNDYIFDCIDMGGWYSKADTRKIPSFSVQTSPTTAQSFHRWIAGSEAWHFALGTTVFPWEGASIGASAVYDSVSYKRQAGSDNGPKGFGVALDFNQRFCRAVDLNIRGAFLRPYNHAGAAINWTQSSSYGDIVWGLYGDYAHGKGALPNHAIFGVQCLFAFGERGYGFPQATKRCRRDSSRSRQDLVEWIVDPAVLMPIILAITDAPGAPSSGSLPDVFVDLGPYSINVYGSFQPIGDGGPRFTATGLPPDSSIDPSTGVISGVNFGLFSMPFHVNVIANYSYGAASSSFILTYETL